jgi:UDP-2,3-diacylglucosamine pyrophosphatase LpxH
MKKSGKSVTGKKVRNAGKAGKRTKRIFISDIHMGDQNSLSNPHRYGWFKKNIPVLANFLNDQLKANDVKEVVILGDLFDEWVIPTEYIPLTSIADICSNPDNQPVIDLLKALAASPDIKLAYVPGNHDMSMDAAGISASKNLIETTFPGIRFFCNSNEPWGAYNVGILAAEHGNHYCLFNAPDKWTAKDTFLPIGYFISRVVAHKVKTTGKAEDYHDILVNFIKDFLAHPNLVPDLFDAIAKDAGLKSKDKINLGNVPGYPTGIATIGDIKNQFSNLIRNWEKTPGNINLAAAIQGDANNLSSAATLAYFSHFGSNVNIVIFGHTHVPVMDKRYFFDVPSPTGEVSHRYDEPCDAIYVNSGCWVDSGKYGCTYVETEEIPDSKRHDVRLKRYPGNKILDEAFIKI